MTIDRETFTEVCIQLKVASDGILKAAKALQLVRTQSDPHDEHAWHLALDGLAGTLGAHDYLEKILCAVLAAQDLPEPTPSVGTA